MQVVSSTEFATHQDKYLNLAIDQDIYIERGKNLFHLTYEPNVEEQPILEPDEDFYNAISAEEFRARALEIVEKVHRKFYGNERKICPKNI